jgi:hypothetical protein
MEAICSPKRRDLFQLYGDSTVTQMWNPIALMNPKDGGDMFSETSVRPSLTRYKVSEDIYNIWRYNSENYKKGYEAEEAEEVVRRRGSHIFPDNLLTDGGDVSLAHRPRFGPKRFLVRVSITRCVEPRATYRMEG